MSLIAADIEAKFQKLRSTERWNCDVSYYNGVEDFTLCESFLYGIHTIFSGALPIDIHIDLKEGLPLVICLNGALSSRDINLKIPVFSGFGVIAPSEASVVRISDPVLYTSSEIKHGWYAGVAGMSLHDDIEKILRKIIETCKPQKIIFFGGSSGGFACLSLSRLFVESLAVVWNPQTDILKFAKEPVLEYSTNAFGISSFEDCVRDLPLAIHSNVYDDYSFGSNRNRVLYMQNIHDWHVRWHCKPFLKATHRLQDDALASKYLGDDFYLHMGDWGDGHAPPSKKFQSSLMKSILDCRFSVSQLFLDRLLPDMLMAAEAVV